MSRLRQLVASVVPVLVGGLLGLWILGVIRRMTRPGRVVLVAVPAAEAMRRPTNGGRPQGLSGLTRSLPRV
ncbi:hypothetical protein ACIBL3_07870 [Kribbella sp. NPDC050124]|uniref:hypothetical protein n=1 Tax=Kribbella sp. NPDC050124 TaxID=3364114 RepID=UPI0037A87733